MCDKLHVNYTSNYIVVDVDFYVNLAKRKYYKKIDDDQILLFDIMMNFYQCRFLNRRYAVNNADECILNVNKYNWTNCQNLQ